jgi:hypothetical protein
VAGAHPLQSRTRHRPPRRLGRPRRHGDQAPSSTASAPRRPRPTGSPDDFLYYEPDRPLDDRHTEPIADLIAEQGIRLCVIDAFNPILSMHNLDPNSNHRRRTFWQLYADPICDAGAAPVLLDHVVKNAETAANTPTDPNGKHPARSSTSASNSSNRSPKAAADAPSSTSTKTAPATSNAPPSAGSSSPAQTTASPTSSSPTKPRPARRLPTNRAYGTHKPAPRNAVRPRHQNIDRRTSPRQSRSTTNSTYNPGRGRVRTFGTRRQKRPHIHLDPALPRSPRHPPI